MSPVSYKAVWLRDYERNRGYYQNETAPFDRWETLVGHGEMAQTYLDHGLRANYGNAGEAISRKFYSASIQIVNRAESEGCLEKVNDPRGAFPLKRGVALRARSYSLALTAQALPTQDLKQSSIDFEEWSTPSTRRDWDGQEQANYLSSARIALVANDKLRFRSLLNFKWPFNYHVEESELLQAMAIELKETDFIQNVTLLKQFRTLFDRYRDPDYQSNVFIEREMVRFELGIFWCRYFESTTSEFSWQQVIDVVSH